MKEAQKKFLGAALAVSSIAGIVAPSVTAMATVIEDEENATPEQLKSVINEYSVKLEKDPIFANYHRVSYAAQRLAQYDEQYANNTLNSISKYDSKVYTKDIVKLVDKMNDFSISKEMKIYDELVNEDIPSVAKTDKESTDYLLGRLDVWGKAIVFEVDRNYSNATDEIVKVNTLREKDKLEEALDQVDVAKKAIKNIVTYEINGKYLEGKLKIEENKVRHDIDEKDLYVREVSAINAREIKVTFNKEVSKDSAEDVLNYEIKAANTDAVTSEIKAQDIELQDDDKSVIIKLIDKNDKGIEEGNALNNKTNAKYLVTIQDILTDNDEEMKEYSEIITLYDDVKPEVTDLEYRDSDTLRVNFSEPVKLNLNGLKSVVKVKLDGAIVTLPSKAISKIDEDGMYFEISRAEAGIDSDKTYSLELNGLTDYAGNALIKFKGDISFEKDTVDPTVEKVEVLAKNALKVTFDEKVKKDTIIAKIDGKTATVSHFEKDQDDQDDKTFILKIAQEDGIDGKAIVSIHDFEDFADNIGDSFSEEVKFEESHPILESTTPEYKTMEGKKYAVYSFDRDVTVGDEDVEVKHVDSDGITKTQNATLHSYKDKGIYKVLESNEIAIYIDHLEEGEYNFDLEKKNVQDDYDQNVEKINLEFIRGSKAIKFEISSVETYQNEDKDGKLIKGSYDNDKIVVLFEKELTKQGIKDASNVNNYLVDGIVVAQKAEVEKAKIVDGDGKTRDTHRVVLTMEEGAIEVDATSRIVQIDGIDGVKSYNDNNNKSIRENTKAKIDTAELTSYNTIRLTMSEEVVNDEKTKNAFEIKIGDTTQKTDKVHVTVNKSIITIKIDGDKPLQTDSKISVKVLDDEDNNKFVKDLAGNITEETTKEVNENFDDSTELAEDAVIILEESCNELKTDEEVTKAEANLILAQAKVEKVNNASERSLLQDRINECKTKIEDAKKDISDEKAHAKKVKETVTKIDGIVKGEPATSITKGDLELVNEGPVVEGNMSAYQAVISNAENGTLDTVQKIKDMIIEVDKEETGKQEIATKAVKDLETASKTLTTVNQVEDASALVKPAQDKVDKITNIEVKNDLNKRVADSIKRITPAEQKATKVKEAVATLELKFADSAKADSKTPLIVKPTTNGDNVTFKLSVDEKDNGNVIIDEDGNVKVNRTIEAKKTIITVTIENEGVTTTENFEVEIPAGAEETTPVKVIHVK